MLGWGLGARFGRIISLDGEGIVDFGMDWVVCAYLVVEHASVV